MSAWRMGASVHLAAAGWLGTLGRRQPSLGSRLGSVGREKGAKERGRERRRRNVNYLRNSHSSVCDMDNNIY
jgi:hypothetical protein